MKYDTLQNLKISTSIDPRTPSVFRQIKGQVLKRVDSSNYFRMLCTVNQNCYSPEIPFLIPM